MTAVFAEIALADTRLGANVNASGCAFGLNANKDIVGEAHNFRGGVKAASGGVGRNKFPLTRVRLDDSRYRVENPAGRGCIDAGTKLGELRGGAGLRDVGTKGRADALRELRRSEPYANLDGCEAPREDCQDDSRTAMAHGLDDCEQNQSNQYERDD